MSNAGLPEWLDVEPWIQAAAGADEAAVECAIGAESPGALELAVLLSPAAGSRIEPMARRALDLTRARFGRTVSLYAPLYLSNHCSGGCLYCGFASDRGRPRRRLELRALREELSVLRGSGIDDILLLTGERAPRAGFPYLRECVAVAAGICDSVSVEAFSMTSREYRDLVAAGCDGVTLYQETYDPDSYAINHRWGAKRDYAARLDAPSRALSADVRTVGLGVLLGLSDPVRDALRLYLHVERLRREFWRGGITVSFPRIRPQAGGFVPPRPVRENFLARLIFAFRICLPEVPLVLSTRESPRFRDGIAGIGITRMSAASRTTVGGYREDLPDPEDAQFEVCDKRSMESFCAMLRKRGIEPVFKNWDAAYRSTASGEPELGGIRKDGVCE